jgi:hypothetical protein
MKGSGREGMNVRERKGSHKDARWRQGKGKVVGRGGRGKGSEEKLEGTREGGGGKHERMQREHRIDSKFNGKE